MINKLPCIDVISYELITEDVIIELKNFIHIDKYINSGGTSDVFIGHLEDRNEYLHLDSSEKIVVKLCKPFLTLPACQEMKTEFDNYIKFNNLLQQKLCYNFPVIYGFYYGCIFYTPEERETIFQLISDKLTEPDSDHDLDALLIYCGSYPQEVLPKSLITYISTKYDSSYILDLVEKFPKCTNINGLLELIIQNDIPENIDWSSSQIAYEYLEEENDMKCSIFLLLQYLPGNNLEELVDKLSNEVFFEYVYSIICSAIVLNSCILDIHLDNGMIIDTNVQRIYHYNDKFFVMKNNKIFYWIDLQIIRECVSSYIIDKAQLLNFSARYTILQQTFIDELFKDGSISPQKVIENLLDWFDNNEGSMNKHESDIYKVQNRNYVYIDINRLFDHRDYPPPVPSAVAPAALLDYSL